MRSLCFRSSKGGLGATSLMTAFGMYLADCGRDVAFNFSPDLLATAGASTHSGDDPMRQYGCSYLPHASKPAASFDWVLYDNTEYTETILVVRNDYVSLKNAIGLPHLQVTGVVCYVDPSRPLTVDDVARCVDAPMLGSIELNPRVACQIDAGLYGWSLQTKVAAVTPILQVCKSIALHLGVNRVVTP
jgi:hypothetical protein